MSISKDGVRIVSTQSRRRQHIFLGICIAVIEVALSIIFYISLGAHVLYPDTTRAGTGAPNLLSYEGYLTDSSGNSLGGTGTPYCFRFSIYDNPTVGAGSKLWPAGTPATTIATSTDGVFSALIGQADSLTYNFYDNDTTYFNVEVYTVAASGGTCTGGSWQTLSPRQQIVSSGYAISSNNIYGSLLQSQTANSRVQVGLGSGAPSPIYLGLDVKSTADYVGDACTTSGTIWYNSAISKALVCENGVVQAVSNSGATTTISGITVNGVAAASTGTVVFSNSNGVTFGLNGNTITASVNAGGGSTLSSFVPAYAFPASTGSQTLGAMGVTSGSAQFYPVSVASNVAFNALRVLANFSFATSTISGQQTISSTFGLYSNNANTLSLISSNSLSFALTNSSVSATLSYASSTGTGGYGYGTVTASTTAQIHSLFGTVGLRRIDLQFGNTMSITPGMYWLGVLRRESSSSANIGISGGLAGNVVVPMNNMGRVGTASSAITTNMSLRAPFIAFGPYTSTGSAGYGGTALPSSVFISGIAHTGTILPFVTFASTT